MSALSPPHEPETWSWSWPVIECSATRPFVEKDRISHCCSYVLACRMHSIVNNSWPSPHWNGISTSQQLTISWLEDPRTLFQLKLCSGFFSNWSQNLAVLERPEMLYYPDQLSNLAGRNLARSLPITSPASVRRRTDWSTETSASFPSRLRTDSGVGLATPLARASCLVLHAFCEKFVTGFSSQRNRWPDPYHLP